MGRRRCALVVEDGRETSGAPGLAVDTPWPSVPWDGVLCIFTVAKRWTGKGQSARSSARSWTRPERSIRAAPISSASEPGDRTAANGGGAGGGMVGGRGRAGDMGSSAAINCSAGRATGETSHGRRFIPPSSRRVMEQQPEQEAPPSRGVRELRPVGHSWSRKNGEKLPQVVMLHQTGVRGGIGHENAAHHAQRRCPYA